MLHVLSWKIEDKAITVHVWKEKPKIALGCTKSNSNVDFQMKEVCMEYVQ